jgi:hypothetical protein
MKAMRFATFIALGLFLSVPSWAGESCKQTQYGPCFTIHGRYETNADAETIWIIGTHKKLMVEDGRDTVREAYGDDPEGYTHYVFGRFTVCPHEKAIAGAMRRVCVLKANELKRTPRKKQ